MTPYFEFLLGSDTTIISEEGCHCFFYIESS